MMFAFLVYFLAVLYVSPCTALDKYYSLWPVASDHSDDNDKITEDLTNRIGSDNFMMSKSPTLGVMYWFAKFSDEDVKHYQGVPGVLYVADLAEVNKPDEDAIRANFKRRASLTRRSMTSQVPASKHLRTISTAPGQDWEKQDGYHFDDTAGQGTRLYIIDSGLDLTHKEFKDYKPDWMYAGPYAEKSQSDSLKAETYAPPHGTAMASVAVGIEQGVAKKASLTVVRSDAYTKQDSNGLDRRTFSPETWIDGLKQVYDDIHDKVKNGEHPKAVINMSWGVAKFLQHPEYDHAVRDTYANLLKSIDSLNAVMLAAAGQPAFGRPTVDTWPQMLAETEVPNLIVVGGVDDDGTHDDSTRTASYVQLFANSVDVDVADARNGDYSITDGTSPACAMTAGLVAYFIGLGNTVPEARKRLYEKAYGRLPNGKGHKVPWNGYDPADTKTKAYPPHFPAPSCMPDASGGFDEGAAINALGDFCTSQTGAISPGAASISKTYDSGPGRHVPIRLAVTWDANDRGPDCPASQSPNQNGGRDCNTIFHSIVNCDNNFSGGGVTWDCGYWSLVFDGESTFPAATTLGFHDSPTNSPFPTPT